MNNGEQYTDDQRRIFIELYRRRFPRKPAGWKYCDIYEFWEREGLVDGPSSLDIAIWNAARLKS